MLKVELLSRESIRPSYPTPPSLRTHRLSWIDQLAPPNHIPIILFYPNAPSAAAETLKESLSQTLASFPLFAGRLLNHPNSPTVDCNDDGAHLFETRVGASMSRFLQGDSRRPDLESLALLLPCDLSCSSVESVGGPLLSVQLNTFADGGFAIGACAAHRVADGLSLATFLGAWSAASRGSHDAPPGPTFTAADLFPPSPLALSLVANLSGQTKKLSTRRFLFEPTKLAQLRGEGPRPPTRVLAVAALVWRCCMRARRAALPRASVAAVVVDIRSRTDPPLSNSAFGNLCAITAAKDDGTMLNLEEKLRAGIQRMDGEWVEKLQRPEGPMLALEPVRDAVGDSGEVDLYYINSWFHFPVHDSDFGWGKPVRVEPARLEHKNTVLLMSAGSGRGMEALVTLEEEEMEGFECDEELCSFVPSTS